MTTMFLVSDSEELYQSCLAGGSIHLTVKGNIYFNMYITIRVPGWWISSQLCPVPGGFFPPSKYLSVNERTTL